MNDKELTFEEAFKQNYALMLMKCKREMDFSDAEDIVSDAFLLLLNNWDSLDNHTEKVLTAWLFRTLNIKCQEFRRKKHKSNLVLSHDLVESVADLSTTDQQIEIQKYREYIVEIQSKLSEKEKSVFDCIVVKQMSIEETALELDITPNATKVRWFRAKIHIKSFIDSILS